MKINFHVVALILGAIRRLLSLACLNIHLDSAGLNVTGNYRFRASLHNDYWRTDLKLLVTRERRYRQKVLIYWVGGVVNSRESHQEVVQTRESVWETFSDSIERQTLSNRSADFSDWRHVKSWVQQGGPTSSLILRDTGRFQGRQMRDQSSLVDNDTQRRIYLHSSQFLRVKSVACLQWTCLQFKETFVARYSASLLLVVVLLFLDLFQ